MATLLVVLPFFSGDEHLLLKSLAWMKELDGRLDYDCLLACDKQTDPTTAKACASELFRTVNVVQYDRALHDHWPHQQNNAFTNTAWHIYAKHKGPWFWCETDSIPTKKGWLDTLWAEYQKGGKPFGGHWNEATGVFNGVAFYPSDISHYSQRMMTATLVSATDAKGQPYQPPWDFYGSKEVRKHLHVMNNVMQHLWDFDGKPITFPDQASVQRLVRPEVVIFHRNKTGDLIDRLRERTHGVELPQITPVVGVTTVNAKPEPRVEIFIVSYWKDADWLGYCLQSIRRFARGFSSVTVACPDVRNGKIAELCAEHKARMVLIREPKGKGHLAQMVAKCHGDTYCHKADYILHVDSDCVFTKETTPQVYFREGIPIMLKRPYESFAQLPPEGLVKSPMVWRAAVTNALGQEPEFETMAALPIIYPCWIYKQVRDAVRQHVKKDFTDYLYSCKADWPYGFCEFNTFGAYAFKHCHDYFKWIDVTKEGFPDLHMRQMWSHSGLDVEHELQPFSGKTPREFIKEVLAT